MEAAATKAQAMTLQTGRDRPARNPGGMVCEECSEVFIGEEWHSFCAICVQEVARRIAAEQHRTSGEPADGRKEPGAKRKTSNGKRPVALTVSASAPSQGAIAMQLRKEAVRGSAEDGSECCYAPKWTCCDQKLLINAAVELDRLTAIVDTPPKIHDPMEVYGLPHDEVVKRLAEVGEWSLEVERKSYHISELTADMNKLESECDDLRAEVELLQRRVAERDCAALIAAAQFDAEVRRAEDAHGEAQRWALEVERLRAGLQWVSENIGAHPENIRKVTRDALAGEK